MCAKVFVWLALFPLCAHAQSPVTGLGRLYIEPLGNNLATLLTAQIIQQRLPITPARSEQDSDCVLFWIPLGEFSSGKTPKKPTGKVAQVKIEGNMAIFDRHESAVVWELNLSTAKFDDLSLADQKKLASKVVHGMNQQGAYCGGAPFSAPAQNAADRTRAFKPPFFNW
jgi:hypothetical protein